MSWGLGDSDICHCSHGQSWPADLAGQPGVCSLPHHRFRTTYLANGAQVHINKTGLLGRTSESLHSHGTASCDLGTGI